MAGRPAQLERLITAVSALSPRARRGIALMTIAVVGIAAASTNYLRPWAALEKRQTAASTYTVVHATEEVEKAVRYEFVSSALVWALSVETPAYGGGNGAGSYRLFRSVDGARTWTKEREGKTAAVWATLLSLRFVDASTGFYAADDPLTLRKTSDRGRTWKTFALPQGQEIQTIQFIDARHGWVTAGSREYFSRLFATDDGGNTWKGPIDVPANMEAWPQFLDAQVGWAGAAGDDHPHLFVSTDGGRSWGSRDLPMPPDLPPGLRFYSGVRLIPGGGLLSYVHANTEDSTVGEYAFRSRDGGASWVQMIGLPGDGAYAIGSVFQDSNHWWLVVDADLYKTSDGGDSWIRFHDVIPPTLSVQRVLDSRHAWGQFFDEPNSSDLALTSDGGLHWTTLKGPSHT